jgi:hypothetical protein
MTMPWALRVLASAIVALGVAACGEETEREPAIEAQEGNEFGFEQIAYRVVLFRELNPEITGDQALVESVERGPDEALYAAFLQACNRGDDPATPTGEITLENAFGTAWQPVEQGVDPSLTYTPRALAPGACLPETGSVADRSFDGAALVFAVPADITSDRPLVLEVREPDSDAGSARVELDL